MSFLAPIAGAVVGGLMSDGGGGQSVSKDPWGPAQQPLKDTIAQAQALQAYQQQNPWNSLQQTGYQNMFTDLDAFRGQNNGLAQFANRLMGTNYQRGAPSQPAGLLSQMQPQQSQSMGLLSPGIFSIPQGQQYGQLNWKELNPNTATGGLGVSKPKEEQAPTAEQLSKEELERLQRTGMLYLGSGA